MERNFLIRNGKENFTNIFPWILDIIKKVETISKYVDIIKKIKTISKYVEDIYKN